jgi:hypothetical protein
MMKRIAATLGVFGVFGICAAAQDPAQAQDKLKKLAEELQTQMRTAVLRVEGSVMGKQVTGAPYSAVEVRETTQVLADGTRIHNENSTTVYRDGEGRMRRETPNEITIFDPVAGFSYSLNPKNLTARKMPMNVGVSGGGRGGVRAVLSGTPPNVIYSTATSTNGDVRVFTSTSGQQLDPAQEDKLKTEKMAAAFQSGQTAGTLQAAAGQIKLKAGNREDLGQQVIEGVASQGTRNTMTFDTNAIGNDRPIQVVSETWTSPDLQTTVMTKHNDPRTGEETFRLTNIRRGEPGADLFQPPANYQIISPATLPARIVPDK